MIGQTISHYKILEKLGGGGMGVVYKAHDTRLDRAVALKFLPPELTLDNNAKERFIHEAKAASSLDHPNICTVYDVDESADGRMFIAMACYEGETLKERLLRGKLKIEEATGIAIQIAQGLAKAHDSGIVHRDVKPANIMITNDGVVKIVDFGLAKLSSATKITKSGSTLGTVAYMAPEQLQGSDVDARADIFSFGVVLYEMLTGRTPFRGDHEAALMYSIIADEPEPLQMHVPDVPSELIHVVGRALEKDPVSRYKTMDDLLIDLLRVRKETSKVSAPAYSGIVHRKILKKILIVASALAFVMVAAVVVFLVLSPTPLPRLNPDAKSRTIQLPVTGPSRPRLSSDGNWVVVYGSNAGGQSELYVMSTATNEARRILQDSSGIYHSSISRDGAWIVGERFDRGKWVIVLVSSQTGVVQSICEGTSPKWGENDQRILYMKSVVDSATRSRKRGVWMITRDGTDNRLVFTDPGISGVAWSYSPSPDGTSLAWLQTSADFSQDVITHDFRTGKDTRVTFHRSTMDEVFWARNNYLIYSANRGGNFDIWMSPAEGGESMQVTFSSAEEVDAQLSDDGSKLLYWEQKRWGNVQMISLETGKITAITADEQDRSRLAISPDGQRVACYGADGSHILFTRGIEIIDRSKGGAVTNLLAETKMGGNLSWSPDGQWIAFVRRQDSVHQTSKICIVSPLGVSSLRVIAEGKPDSAGGTSVQSVRWIDDKTLSWYSRGATWMSSIETTHPTKCYQDSTFAYIFRNQRYLLFRDYRRGRLGWWVDNAPHLRNQNTDHIKKILPPVGASVSPDGRFLLYRTSTGELQKVLLPDGKVTALGMRTPTGGRFSGVGDITADGKHLAYVAGSAVNRLVLVENPFIWK